MAGSYRGDGPTFLASIGWDWIPTIRDRNIGIWQKVTVSGTGPVVLEDPTVSSDLPLPRTDTADLTVEATVRNVTDSPQTGALKGSFEGVAFEAPITRLAAKSRIQNAQADARDDAAVARVEESAVVVAQYVWEAQSVCDESARGGEWCGLRFARF